MPPSHTAAPVGRLTPFRIRPVRWLVLAALVAGVGAGSALAGVQTGVTPARLASPDIQSMISTQRHDGVWRALVGSEFGVPYLVIEHFARGRVAAAPGLPTLQRRLDAFEYGYGRLAFSGQALALDALAWRGRALHFALDTGTERLTCRVPVRGRGAFVARCDGDGAPPQRRDGQTQRPDRRTNWAADADVIRACGAATFGDANQSACLDRVARFAYDPAPVVAACDAAMFGDDNTLACIAAAGHARRDPSAALNACDAAMFGDDNALRCFETAAQARYEPTKAIAACDAAMFGDDNALACIREATRAVVDVSQQVRVCDEAMYGDDAALACLRRGISL